MTTNPQTPQSKFTAAQPDAPAATPERCRYCWGTEAREVCPVRLYSREIGLGPCTAERPNGADNE